MIDPVDVLPPFLRNYIIRNGWTALKSIQKRTLEIVDESGCNILISAGTSGGKTEAAFFPVITSLYRDKPKGIGALYISPLKALIDDQNERLERMLRDSDIQVFGWHADASQSRKDRLRSHPEGIVQITPESLQGLILFHHEDIAGMFSDLRFIVIDEVHAFMNSTRGLQLLCAIGSVCRIAGCSPRMVGLSATLSDLAPAEEWLSAVNGQSTETVSDSTKGEYRISLRHFHLPKEDEGRYNAILNYYKSLYRDTDPYNCIVFVNSRIKAERTSKSLRTFTQNAGSGKRVAIHHGSISSEIRKDSEAKLKTGDFKTTLVATMTMELGIDVGDVERIIQLEPPHSSSSFVQRMGRSGRRTGRPVMIMYSTDDDTCPYDTPLGFSQSLLQALAMVRLYEVDHWVEPMQHSRLPYSLLFQQILILVAVSRGIQAESLIHSLLMMYPFREISEDDCRDMVTSMVESDVLTVYAEEGTLLVGEAGERLLGPRTILAMFEDDNDYLVVSKDKTIGYLPKEPKMGSKVLLGGQAWLVTGMRGHNVAVQPIQSEAVTKWGSGIPDVHTKVVRTMRDILLGEDVVVEMDEASRSRLDYDREMLRNSGAGSGMFVRDGDDIEIYPWLGTVQFDTLLRLIHRMDSVKIIDVVPLFKIRVLTAMNTSELYEAIEHSRTSVNPLDLFEKGDDLESEKFDSYVPRYLLKKKFVTERIDLNFELFPP